MKIVLICANQEIAARVGEIIQRRWYEANLIVIPTAEEGLEVVQRAAPDLVIICPDFSDVYLSELIQRLRFFSDVPLVVLGDYGDELGVVTVLELGADIHVQWPSNPVVLMARIQALLRRASFGMEQQWEDYAE